jgi:dienelactone hydrolase
MDAAVDFLTRLPEVKPSNAIVVGQSAGGWGAIAYASAPHPKVAAFVVMAGGRGGHRDNRPHNNCRPDLLADSAGHFGKTARTPMLWIYGTDGHKLFFGSRGSAVWSPLVERYLMQQHIEPR